MTELERRLLHLRWTGYGLLVTSFILAFFHRNTPAAMADALARDWGAGPAALGALSASYFWVYTVMQIPTGILADRLGPRRIVSLGMAVAGVGTLVFAWAPDVVWGTVGRVLIGLGVAFPFISLMKFSAVWFPERQFATLSGLTVFIGNVGAALAATPLVWL
ncbi:MAG: MFS transporter, partial [Betaproteobacteria bacterium]|nr:MFS transporter [Betaproteobacteria bacterium]